MAPYPCLHLQLGHGRRWQEKEAEHKMFTGYCEAGITESSSQWSQLLQESSSARLQEGAFW